LAGEPVRGIALKIFLSFWLIFALLIASFAVLPNEGAGVRFADHLHQHGVIAAALLERDGRDGCDRYAALLAERQIMALSLSNDAGEVLCGAPPSPGAGTGGVIGADGTTITIAGLPQRAFSGLAQRPPFPYNAVLLAIVVSGVVCFWMARSLARPLQDVRDASRRLTDGDLQARASVPTAARHDEFGDLGRAFNAMAARIEALLNAQGQLLSDISHELRSPLARLHVALELVRRKAGPALETDLARIETEANRMNDLIGRVLSLARAEHDQSAEAAEPFELVDVVRDVAADARFEAAQQQKSVVLVTTASPLVVGRSALIASAVDNIVRNAVRHTPVGSAVTIDVDATADHAIVRVSDHGPGVPESELERIFAPFHRAEAGRSQQQGGVGLGLAIAKRAIAVHDGSIAAANTVEGGLCVTIHLPRYPDPPG
jgi:signal transduction histidine kinase